MSRTLNRLKLSIVFLSVIVVVLVVFDTFVASTLYIYTFFVFCPILSVAQEEIALSLLLNQIKKVVFFFIFLSFISLMKWNEKRIKRFVDGNPQLCRQPRIFRNNLTRDRSSQLRSSRFLFLFNFSPLFHLSFTQILFRSFQGLLLISKPIETFFLWFWFFFNLDLKKIKDKDAWNEGTL